MVAKAPFPAGGPYTPGPYVLSALAPYTAGTLLAVVSGFPLRPGVFILGLVGVAALVTAAFAARELFAPALGRGPSWQVPADARGLALICLCVAAAAGLLLQFVWRTGDLTIPLGGLGALGGYFYFAPPLQWGRRGLGEAAGAMCFGLLPVAAGLYLQCGHLLTEVLLYGLPLSFAGFNLFLIYGFPGPADQGAAPERFSLASRLGPLTGALLYTIFNVLTILGLLAILLFPAPALPWRLGLWPLLILAVVNQELIKRKSYLEEAGLRRLGRLSLALHLGMGLVFVLMLWQRV